MEPFALSRLIIAFIVLIGGLLITHPYHSSHASISLDDPNQLLMFNDANRELLGDASKIFGDRIFEVNFGRMFEGKSQTQFVKVLPRSLDVKCYTMPSEDTNFYYGFQFTKESWKIITSGNAAVFGFLRRQREGRFLAVNSRDPSQTFPEVNKSVIFEMKDESGANIVDADGKFWRIQFVFD